MLRTIAVFYWCNSSDCTSPTACRTVWRSCFAQILGMHSWVALKRVALLNWLLASVSLKWKFIYLSKQKLVQYTKVWPNYNNFRIGQCGSWSFDKTEKICYLHSVDSCCGQFGKRERNSGKAFKVITKEEVSQTVFSV